MAEDNNLPKLTEKLAINTVEPQQISAVDYIYDSIKSKASAPSLLEKIDNVQNDSDYFSGIFNSTQDSKVSFNEERININEAYSKLSDGRYITRYDEGFIKGADNEQLYANRQSTVSKWTNGLTKFVGKTANNVVGGTLGTAYGAISAIVEGNWERVYDNEFYDFLDDQNSKMDNFMANYRTQEERDLGFFSSMGTANFWADDFLGGMSFMTGTVISEALWALGTGGTSLTTTATRVGLRASKYFNTAIKLTKGVKEAQKVARQYNRLSAMKRGTELATKYGRAGEALNLARFTYTGAGFESGMEARMYQKEQRESFNRDFETLNGRKPSAEEVAEFENKLGSTTNALWATNMALVGTSNFAVLGKTFGISSPFKLPSKKLNKTLFGVGVETKVGKTGERLESIAIKRNKLQKTLGFGKAVLKNPFYEGVVEEGGQAASSTAMESYLTSRYNPSEEAMGIAESFYEGMSHTYGTKEGWKEVGLGALIGLVGGESANVASGQGLFREAREALNDQDSKSVARADSLNKNLGTKVADRIFATKLEENIAHATELQDAQKEFDSAEDKGSVMGMANAQGRVMLTSVKHAVDFDYLEDQIIDFETGLRMQDPEQVAEHFGIEVNDVNSKIDELLNEYKDLANSYESAKNFADYVVSDNSKEVDENGNIIDARVVRTAIAYQMVMTEIMEKNMEGAYEALIDSVSELNPQLSSKYMQALNRFNQINRSKKEDVEALGKAENKLKLKQLQLERLNKQLLKLDQTRAQATPEGNQKDATRYNNLANKITEVQEQISVLTADVADKNSKLADQKTTMASLNASTRALASQLDAIDPLAGEDLVSQTTLEETRKSLDDLDKTLKEINKLNPLLVQKITKLGKEYRDGLEMWQRNADTLQDLADPELGLKRVGTMLQRKKAAGETTLQFLKRLQKSQVEELEFSTNLDRLMSPTQEDETDNTVEELNEQELAEEDQGEDILRDNDIQSQINIIENKRQEEIQNLVSNEGSSYGVIAADYLLTGGFNSMLSTDYLLQAFSGVFINSNEIDQIRNKYAQELADKNLTEVKDFINSDLYDKIIAEIKDTVKSSYGNNPLIDEIFNDILKYPSGMPNRLGNKIQSKINKLHDEIIESINEKYDKEIENINTDNASGKVNELKSALNKLVGENSFVLENFTNDSQQLEQDKVPTQAELDEYNQIREDFKSGDINKLVGRPIDQIGRRVKERSGLTDEQINRYQELSQKMLDWRIVTGTNAEGVSIQDILDQIEAYEQELQDNNTQVSAEQVLEMAEQGQSEFSVDTSDPNYVNSMDKVNIKQDKIQTTISHVDIKTILDSDFNVTYLREDNRGTEDKPDLAGVYLLEKEGEAFEIQYTNDHHRIIVSNKNTREFLDGMNMQTVKYNTKTGWGYVFRDGVPMESDFGINLINNPEVNILNPQLIYELQPGDKLSFAVNVQDVYNNETIVPLIEAGQIDSAKKLMSVYVVNQNGDVLGFLKSGATASESNFNKVREEAFNALQEKLSNTEITLEDLANDNSNSVLNVPYEVEVEKTFVGTPNIELNPDRSTKVYKITEEQSKLITGFGYAENGVLSEVNENVRKTFIPKNKNTPYVIIQHGNTEVAFPVGLTPTDSTLQNQVLEILDSESREQDKITNIINLLKQNGVEPAQFNLDSLKDNTNELNRLLRSLDGSVRTYSKEELSKMSLEEFTQAAEIIINLDKPAFVSPKIKMSLSKKLINTKTKEETASKKLTASERQNLMIQHLLATATATKAEEVEKLVTETGDEVFIKEFLENTKFRKQVIKASLVNKTVPSIQTDVTMENILEDIIDINYNDIPLDIKEQFNEEVAELKANPVKSKVKSLANKIKKQLENRYKLVDSAVNTDSMYHIPTTETEGRMFDQGYVKVVGDFYKKVDKKYNLPTLLEGLYNKYKKGTLPTHFNLEEGMSLDEFTEEMPNTLLDVYKMYYNTQESGPISKKAVIIGNDQYLKEEFKGDFAEFIQQEKNKGSELYKQVLQHFQITDKGVLKDDLLTRYKIDQFQKELGKYYGALLNYSLINKHIDLHEQSQNIIFVEDVDDINRIEAVNNPNLVEPKTQASIIDDKTISFTKVNKPFIQHKGNIYEQVFSNKQGDYVYERIAKVDPNFLITEVAAPFSTASLETNKEIDETKTNINTTDGREIDC